MDNEELLPLWEKPKDYQMRKKAANPKSVGSYCLSALKKCLTLGFLSQQSNMDEDQEPLIDFNEKPEENLKHTTVKNRLDTAPAAAMNQKDKQKLSDDSTTKKTQANNQKEKLTLRNETYSVPPKIADESGTNQRPRCNECANRIEFVRVDLKEEENHLKDVHFWLNNYQKRFEIIKARQGDGKEKNLVPLEELDYHFRILVAAIEKYELATRDLAELQYAMAIDNFKYYIKETKKAHDLVHKKVTMPVPAKEELERGRSDEVFLVARSIVKRAKARMEALEMLRNQTITKKTSNMYERRVKDA